MLGLTLLMVGSIITPLANVSPQSATLLAGSPVVDCGIPNAATPQAQRCVIVKDSATAVSEIDAGQLPPGTQWVLFDDEDWAATPVADQVNIGEATHRLAVAAHAHGLMLIDAPSFDIEKTRVPNGTKPLWQEFLDQGIPGTLAKAGADVIEAQTQPFEPRGTSTATATFTTILRGFQAQITAAGSTAALWGGISSNPPGTAPTVTSLEAALRAGAPLVSGWWVNVPGSGTSCPKCGPADPQMVAAALVAVYGS